MLQRSISYKGVVILVGIERNMDSQYYCSVPEKSLMNRNDNMLDENWILRLGSTAIHTSKYTKK